MKIRTDFVTNSSSSSYIRLTVDLLNDESLTGSFENFEGHVEGSRYFAGSSDKFLDNFKSGEELVNAAWKWFYNGILFKNHDKPEDYEKGDMNKIRKLNSDDILSLRLSWGCHGDDIYFDENRSCTYTYKLIKGKTFDDEMEELDLNTKNFKDIYLKHIGEYSKLSYMEKYIDLIDFEHIPSFENKYFVYQCETTEMNDTYGWSYNADLLHEELETRGAYPRIGSFKKADYYVLWNDSDDNNLNKMLSYKQSGLSIVFISLPQLWKAFQKHKKLTKKQLNDLIVQRKIAAEQAEHARLEKKAKEEAEKLQKKEEARIRREEREQAAHERKERLAKMRTEVEEAKVHARQANEEIKRQKEVARMAKIEKAAQIKADRQAALEEGRENAKILYAPGEEPEELHTRINNLMTKLDVAYPDHVIHHLGRDHGHWDEEVGKLYKTLGYYDRFTFLEAYGFTLQLDPGGRTAVLDPDAVIEELKRRYPEGTTLQLVQLIANNKDLPLKTLQNKSSELFGMGLIAYLKELGIKK